MKIREIVCKIMYTYDGALTVPRKMKRTIMKLTIFDVVHELNKSKCWKIVFV